MKLTDVTCTLCVVLLWLLERERRHYYYYFSFKVMDYAESFCECERKLLYFIIARGEWKILGKFCKQQTSRSTTIPCKDSSLVNVEFFFLFCFYFCSSPKATGPKNVSMCHENTVKSDERTNCIVRFECSSTILDCK